MGEGESIMKKNETEKPTAEMTEEEWLEKNPPLFLRNPPRPKAILAEVGPRMRAAVEENPAELKLIAKDANGNTVIERPYRAPRKEEAMSVDTRGGSAVGAMRWGRDTMLPGQGLVWRDREGRGDALVRRNYDIYAVLREDD
jgi:hypothetical protein